MANLLKTKLATLLYCTFKSSAELETFILVDYCLEVVVVSCTKLKINSKNSKANSIKEGLIHLK